MTEELKNQEASEQEKEVQDTQQSNKLFADKYKSVEELEKAYKEAERMLQEMSERAKRTEELLNVYLTTQPQVPATKQEEISEEDYSKIIENPKEVLSKFASEIEAKITNKILQQIKAEQQAKYIYDYFYTKYSDLKGYEPIVGYFADINQRKYPNKPIEELLEMVAQDTRKYIAEKKLASSASEQKPLNVAEPKKVHKSSSTVSEEERILSPEEELQIFLEERKKEKQKKIV